MHFNVASPSKTLLPNNNKDEDASTDVDHDDNINGASSRQPQSDNCVSKMPSLLRSSTWYMQ